MTFDPSAYQKKVDWQTDPSLPDDEWTRRFIAHLTKFGEQQANEKFKPEVAKYAAEVAPSYLIDRKDYADPEEAADTDLSYWEDEE